MGHPSPTLQMSEWTLEAEDQIYVWGLGLTSKGHSFHCAVIILMLA